MQHRVFKRVVFERKKAERTDNHRGGQEKNDVKGVLAQPPDKAFARDQAIGNLFIHARDQ